VLPILLESGKGVYASIAEASVFSNYGASQLSSTEEDTTTLYITETPDEFTELKAPTTSPWRVILAGSLDEIVNSNTLENLNPPSIVDDPSFIKPGMVAWSWITENFSPSDFERQKAFVDFAASMGWPYSLDDAGWHLGGEWTASVGRCEDMEFEHLAVDIPELVRYAKEKGVDIWIWEHRRTIQKREHAERCIKRWAEWGVAGLKIDFFESDTRERLSQHEMMAELCAKYHLMLNFHGCTKPSGEIRHWPHVLTREGVFGAENFQGYSKAYPIGPSAAYNCLLPFTRNVLGPMDYTPVNFEEFRHGTSDTHQAALPVVFTSYVCHAAVSPETCLNHPAGEFLKQLPTAWDESKLLEGEPECYVTMARRKGDDWYIGGICASRPRVAKLDLSFLAEGEYTATLYKDSLEDLFEFEVPVGVLPMVEPAQYQEWEKIFSRPNIHMHDMHLTDVSTFTVKNGEKLQIPCVMNGGFCLKLQKN